jgi:hypothetical protein
MAEVQQQIRQVCREIGDNIIFLENEIYLIPGTDIIVFGATFWSDVKAEEAAYVNNMIGDYKYIQGFTVEKCRELHKTSCLMLTAALAKYSMHKFVVISHHLPLYTLIDSRYETSCVNSAYASDIKEANNDMIVAWVAGHTHTPIEKERFHVNAIGYKGENVKKDFNKVFEV